MVIDDARDLTLAAGVSLTDYGAHAGLPGLTLNTLPQFLALADRHQLTRQGKKRIIDQAILLLDQFYAHLPFKRARFAVDPVQRLRLLRSEAEQLSDLPFHAEMVAAFTEVRDAHTYYSLPTPFRGAFAFLPFQLGCFYDRRHRPRFLVTRLMEGFEHPHFGLESEITAWNGIPLELAVQREGARFPGANRSARMARGLTRLTARSLTFQLPPDEAWVTLQYTPAHAGKADDRGIVLPWSVVVGLDALSDLFVNAPDRQCDSLYAPASETANACKLIWGRQELTRERYARSVYGMPQPPSDTGAPPIDPAVESLIPELFTFQHSSGALRPGVLDPAYLRPADQAGKKYGYIQIKSFDRDPDDFVDEFTRLLGIMQTQAPDGLILDVRSNPGGAIDAAERSLQLLTPVQIQPALFHVINTRSTQQVAIALAERIAVRATAEVRAAWLPWIEDLRTAVASGKTITAGRALTHPDLANNVGQRYHGPVILLIDAMTYSAAEIFAAGFEDHGIGPILGVDPNTGGGGANRWRHEEIQANLKGIPHLRFDTLPLQASFGLAIRRCSRSGASAGQPLEDVGVRSSIVHRMTQADLRENGKDLILRACRELGSRPAYHLSLTEVKLTGSQLSLRVTSRNLHRLDFLLDGFTQCAVSAGAAETESQQVTVPLTNLVDPPALLKVRGFSRLPDETGASPLQFVASVSMFLHAEQAAEAVAE